MKERFSKINTPSDVRSLLLYSPLHCEHPEILRQRILGGFEVQTIKQNSKRKIYRLNEPDGKCFYLKLYARQFFPFSMFRFYAAKEYRIARDLEEMGIPIIHYLAWGKLQQGGFCLSEGIVDAVPLLQYFFQTLRYDPSRMNGILVMLGNLIRSMKEKHIVHPDFHLGNILYCHAENKLYLVDPWGIHDTLWYTRTQRIQLCLPWLEMRGSIPDAQLVNGILQSGLADTSSEAENWIQAGIAYFEAIREHHWPKLCRRILSGKSKYATEISVPEGQCAFRHTLWFTPPESWDIRPEWKKVEYANAAANESIWLNSFLRTPPIPNPPLARLIRKDGSSVLYYAE